MGVRVSSLAWIVMEVRSLEAILFHLPGSRNIGVYPGKLIKEQFFQYGAIACTIVGHLLLPQENQFYTRWILRIEAQEENDPQFHDRLALFYFYLPCSSPLKGAGERLVLR